MGTIAISWRPSSVVSRLQTFHISSFFSETTGAIGTKLSRNVFRSSRIFNMAAKANNMLWLAEISKIFFSETNELTEPKLYRNDHWNVLYKVTVFYDDRKSKMAAIAGLSLTLDPMGKMFQNASSLKPLGQLKPNCPGMIIGRSSTKFLFFMPIENPRWPPPQDID